MIKKLLTLVAFVPIFSIALSLVHPDNFDPVKPIDKSYSSFNLNVKPRDVLYTAMSAQEQAPWYLDNLDSLEDGIYNYISSGSGVKIYVLDTGVDADHPQLVGRVSDGYDAFSENLQKEDCHGHGTHIAGIAAGQHYGVAKSATIVPVRVLNCKAYGTTTTLLSGIDWVLSQGGGEVSVVNMSLGGAYDERVNTAVDKLIQNGFSVVAAAGNSNSDACLVSPAGAPGVVAVGAHDRSFAKASFSNWGSCVDIFAPGVEISSANPFDHSVASRKSGTSQSSAFVAGAIATYISAGLSSTAETVERKLKTVAKIDGPVGPILQVETAGSQVEEPVQEPVTSPEDATEPEVPDTSNNEPPVEDVTAPIEEAPTAESPNPDTSVESPDPVSYPEELYVSVTQVGVGSYEGLLEWSPVKDASRYYIYKKSTARPNWRLFWIEDSKWTYQTIVDEPGTVAIYRIVAMVGSSEVLVGEFRYQPTE